MNRIIIAMTSLIAGLVIGTSLLLPPSVNAGYKCNDIEITCYSGGNEIIKSCTKDVHVGLNVPLWSFKSENVVFETTLDCVAKRNTNEEK